MNVLVVSDNPNVETHVAQLAQQVSDVVVVGRISRSPNLVSQVQTLQAHVVLVDISAAGMSGLDSIYRLRMAMPDLGIIAVSAMATTSAGRSACECGADGFICISELETHLLAELRRASARHEPTNRGINTPNGRTGHGD